MSRMSDQERARAISIDAAAQHENTDAAWQVAADAWEAAGDLDRARFAWLRQPSLNYVISDEYAEDIRGRLDDWNAIPSDQRQASGGLAFTSGGARGMRHFTPPSAAELSNLARYDLFANAPPRFEGWLSYGDRYVTTGDDDLYHLARVLRTSRAHFRRIQGRERGVTTIRVAAINGYEYVGYCTLAERFCVLKRSKPWLPRLRTKRIRSR